MPRATSGRKTCALVDAAGELVDVWIQQLCAIITLGSNADDDQKRRRDALASLLNNLPVVHRDLNAAARNDERYAALLFYERTRLRAGDTSHYVHYLEAVPRGLSIFSDNHGEVVAFGDDASADVNFPLGFFAQREAKIRELEAAAFVREQPFGVDDLSRGLPDSVLAFVSFTRRRAHTLRANRPAVFFCNCSNQQCKRLTFCGRLYPPPPAAHEASSYWQFIDNRGDLRRDPSTFCSWVCLRLYESESDRFKAEMPSVETLDADSDACRKEGRGRVSEALRLCGKRNERIGRILRDSTTAGAYRYLPVKELFRTLVLQVNIDLALLYAANELAESKAASAGRVLAGAKNKWRSNMRFFARSINRIKGLYRNYHTGLHVISNFWIDEPLLRKVKQVASTLF